MHQRLWNILEAQHQQEESFTSPGASSCLGRWKPDWLFVLWLVAEQGLSTKLRAPAYLPTHWVFFTLCECANIFPSKRAVNFSLRSEPSPLNPSKIKLLFLRRTWAPVPRKGGNGWMLARAFFKAEKKDERKKPSHRSERQIGSHWMGNYRQAERWMDSCVLKYICTCVSLTYHICLYCTCSIFSAFNLASVPIFSLSWFSLVKS